MRCEEVREHCADHVIGEIDDAVRDNILTHLMWCASCASEVEMLRDLWADLGDLPSAEPDAGARARFDFMLKTYQEGVDGAFASSGAAKSHWPSRWPPKPALQFALGIALIVGGVFAGYLLRPSAPSSGIETNSEIAALREELTGMRQMVALSLLQQQSASDRLKGVNWSHQLEQPGQEVLRVLLDTLMHDTNVNVRLATIDALRQFGDRPAVRKGVVDAIRSQEFPMVQVALIDLAVDLGEKQSIETLRQLSKDEKLDVTVRERAQKGLVELE